MPTSKTYPDSYPLKISDKLREQLELEAAKQERSLNGQIAFILKNFQSEKQRMDDLEARLSSIEHIISNVETRQTKQQPCLDDLDARLARLEPKA